MRVKFLAQGTNSHLWCERVLSASLCISYYNPFPFVPWYIRRTRTDQFNSNKPFIYGNIIYSRPTFYIWKHNIQQTKTSWTLIEHILKTKQENKHVSKQISIIWSCALNKFYLDITLCMSTPHMMEEAKEKIVSNLGTVSHKNFCKLNTTKQICWFLVTLLQCILSREYQKNSIQYQQQFCWIE